MVKHFDIETPESQTAAESADDLAVIRNAMKHEFPGEWLTKACRVGCVPQARRERLRDMLAQRVELVDFTTVDGDLPHGCFTVSQA